MNLDEIKEKIKACLLKLYTNDRILFERNEGKGACERCLVFRLGIYLQEVFPDYFVDCDFNSARVNGEDVNGKPIMNPDGTTTNRFVDIIVHKRLAVTDTDFICFEIKKWNHGNRVSENKDKQVLTILTSQYGYKYGFYLIFGENLQRTRWMVFHRNQSPEPMGAVFQNETDN